MYRTFPLVTSWLSALNVSSRGVSPSKTMDLIEIYIIGSQAAQTRFACADQVVPRSADIVFAGPHSEKRFCGNQNSIAPSLAQDSSSSCVY
jgi:hypothetical protein